MDSKYRDALNCFNSSYEGDPDFLEFTHGATIREALVIADRVQQELSEAMSDAGFSAIIIQKERIETNIRVFADDLTAFLKRYRDVKDVYTDKRGLEIMSDFFRVIGCDPDI